jgi:O-antigen ligase
MAGAFAAGILALVLHPRVHWGWFALTAFLALGVAVTFGRGAMLGTTTGLLGILSLRRRKLAIALGAVTLAGVLVLVAGAAGWIALPDFLPKIGFAGRNELWSAAIANLRVYGPLGVGSGQADSIPGMGIHNFILEQYGEGGILTTLGVLGWLVLPIVHLRRSRLSPALAWAIVSAMAGLMVHGIFWSQFLNGLRFLTLVYVCLWTALGTTGNRIHESGSRSRNTHS